VALTMKWMMIAAIVLLVVAHTTVVFAQQSQVPQQFPQVRNLEPFSAETNFMSLPGYLRWVVFQQQGQWLSHDEAARIVSQQGQ
jgi:hypothetical protein